MNKHKSILLALALVVSALFSFKQYEQTTAKETMTVVVTYMSRDMLINISTAGDNNGFEQKRIKVKNEHDYSGVLKIVREYQDKGWQIKNSNYTRSADPYPVHNNYLYFLLEK